LFLTFAFAATASALVGPLWTHSDMEAPAGEKDMGGWMSSVYTPEQMARLSVDEFGQQKKETENADLDLEELSQFLPGILPVMFHSEDDDKTHTCDCPPAMAMRQCSKDEYENNRKSCGFYVREDAKKSQRQSILRGASSPSACVSYGFGSMMSMTEGTCEMMRKGDEAECTVPSGWVGGGKRLHKGVGCEAALKQHELLRAGGRL